MRYFALTILVLAAAGALVVACGGGGSAGSASAGDAARGLQKFRANCATCHGANAEGMPRLGKALHGNEFVRARSDAELLQFLKEGRPATHPDNTRGVAMPPKGGNPALTDDQLKLIVAYMRSIQ